MRALACVLLLAACGGGEDLAKREPDEYVGCATDETWELFDTSTDIVDNTQAPLVTTPANDATVGNNPVDIDWQPTPSVVGTDAGDIPMSCVSWNTGYSTLHLPPITGTVYDLQVLVGGQDVHRVLTSLQKWTASADTWSKLAGETIEVHLVRMVVNEGDLMSGPFAQTAPLTLTISK